MKKKPLLWLVALALLCLGASGGIVVWWYSMTGQAQTLNDTDILLLERGPRVTNLWFTLAQLKTYVGGGGGGAAPVISSFSNNKGNQEIGSTVNSTVLNWTLSGGAPASQVLNLGIGPIPVGTLTYTDPTSYSTLRTWTLTVSNSVGSVSSSTSVNFLSKRYWGPQAATSLNDAQIIALNGELATGFAGFNHTIVCSAQYIYFAFPQSFGVPNVNVNGLLNTAWQITARAFVNASGASVNYYIYRSNNLLTGTYIVQLVP